MNQGTSLFDLISKFSHFCEKLLIFLFFSYSKYLNLLIEMYVNLERWGTKNLIKIEKLYHEFTTLIVRIFAEINIQFRNC